MSSTEMPYGDIETYEHMCEGPRLTFAIPDAAPGAEQWLATDAALEALTLASKFLRPLSLRISFEDANEQPGLPPVVRLRTSVVEPSQPEWWLEEIEVDQVDADAVRNVIVSRVGSPGNATSEQQNVGWDVLEIELMDTLLGPASSHEVVTVHDSMANEEVFELIQYNNQTWIHQPRLRPMLKTFYFTIDHYLHYKPDIEIAIDAGWSVYGHEDGAQVQRIVDFAEALKERQWEVGSFRPYANDVPFYHSRRDR